MSAPIDVSGLGTPMPLGAALTRGRVYDYSSGSIIPPAGAIEIITVPPGLAFYIDLLMLGVFNRIDEPQAAVYVSVDNVPVIMLGAYQESVMLTLPTRPLLCRSRIVVGSLGTLQSAKAFMCTYSGDVHA